METNYFEVSRIEGEYAYIKECGVGSSEEIFIAIALLPFGVDVGSKLIRNGFEFELVN